MSSEKDLIEILNALNDYEISAKALTDLMNLNPQKAIDISLDILNTKKGDEFFQASAFDTLYYLSPTKAHNFFLSMEEPNNYLLGAILNNVTSDFGIYSKNIIVQKFVRSIKLYLSQKSNSDYQSIKEEIIWFNKAYE